MLETLVPALAGAIIGGAITGGIAFFVQKWYFNQLNKKRTIEEVYFPILDELEMYVENSLKNFQEVTIPKWVELKGNSKYRWIPENLRNKIRELLEIKIIGNYNIHLNACNRLVQEELVKQLKDVDIAGNINLKDFGFSRIILQKDIESGGYINSMPDIEIFQEAYNKLKENGKIKNDVEDLDHFILFLAIQIKENPLLKQLRKEREEFIIETNSLKKEIQDQTK